VPPLPRGRFEVVARHRPVAIVGAEQAGGRHLAPGTTSAGGAVPQPAPYAALEVDLDTTSATDVELALVGPDDTPLRGWLTGAAVHVGVGASTRLRSRRHGRAATRPERFAITLTGAHLTALTCENGRWVARGRIDLRDVDGAPDPHDVDWLAGLEARWRAASAGTVAGWRAGGYGQLGLRDLRVVTTADGTPHRPAGALLLTATSAGPGFFDTAHTSVWRLDAPDAPDAPAALDGDSTRLEHCADLFFERPDRPGVFGDHATHLVRDGERWLVATSTWGDFAVPRRGGGAGRKGHVDVTLAESSADLTTGRHRLATRPLPLPVDGLDSVGVWDPHLVRDGGPGAPWLVGFVSARRYFDFHPAVAAGPGLDRLALVAAATDRTATEGTTIWRDGSGWCVLASDGPDSPRRLRRRFPVLEASGGRLEEVATLDAAHPTNLPWPTLVPPATPDGDWLLVTFDGTPHGGDLAGYGTHGDVVVLRAGSAAGS
jgi:hypothetical protein